jgi:hypothetical protein
MDILSRPVLVADHRIRYGDDASQFGDLWLPNGAGPFPLVVFFHGGWWKSKYDLGYAGYLCAALRDGLGRRAGVGPEPFMTRQQVLITLRFWVMGILSICHE